ncbi:response regulator [Zhouia sp. PK063]|uniref:response regulator n=1 Tax=Zhouia sp. PK063 TaxID=3373602 RepID=UPI0037A15067
MKTYSIVIVDDHLLFSQSLEYLISTFLNFKVQFTASNGKEFTTKVDENNLPDIVLLDMNMPVMNGMETMKWIKENHPSIKVIALSMDDDEDIIIKMLRIGANGYLLKDTNPLVFKQALNDVAEKGVFFSDIVTNAVADLSETPKNHKDLKKSLKKRELEFLQLVCTEMTYKEIAQKMSLSPKTVDGYRENLFEKLQVKNRIGLVLVAIKENLIEF